MSKIHINSKGEPGACKATTGACPFGGEETHFSNPEEAAKAYETAQNVMGNGINGREIKENGDYEDDNNYATFESKEDALKVANIIANEGKFAGIVTVYTSYAQTERPDEDDFEDNDDYEEAVDEWNQEFESSTEGPSENAEVKYHVRGFDKWEDRNKISPDAWAPNARYMDEIDLDLDGDPDDVFEQRPSDDSTNDRWWNTTFEFKAPKES